MQLECPNCAARYGVDDARIPRGGREVKCSACGHIWHFAADRPNETAAEADHPEPEEREAPPARRDLDPRVAEILRDEASRDRDARARGPRSEPPPNEPRPPSATSRASGPRRPPGPEARLRSPAAVAAASRGDLPPDDGEAAGPTLDVHRSDPDPGTRPHAPRRRSRGNDGFAIGFGLMAAVATALILLYVFAPAIALRAPGLEPTLTRYVGDVNAVRAALDTWIDRGIEELRALIGETG